MRILIKKAIFLYFIQTFSIIAITAQQITPETALYQYINNTDKTYGWEVRDTYQYDNVSIKSILLLSQKWQGILWKHELLICVPAQLEKDAALLYITGGSIRDGFPVYTDSTDGITKAISTIAIRNKAITAVLRQTPNQPLMGGLNEDALISYTLDEFRKTGDFSLPLLFPMVKSATKAMDCIQEYVSTTTKTEIKQFMITGASKRGWTTWLTAACGDKRVKAIAPMVIDMLNMPITLDYQQKIYGDYSEEINDYTKLNIPQAVHTDFGKAIVTMIDPYSYRDKLTVPKLITMGTNDEYWTIDAIKHYLKDIPGKNFLHYIPNVGHSLGDKIEAIASIDAFFGITFNSEDYPQCDWELIEKAKKVTLKVKITPDKLIKARLWKAQSSSRDFRKSPWKSSDITVKAGLSLIETTLPYPTNDFQAFYIELIYKDINKELYSITTQVYVTDRKQVLH